MSAMRSSAHHFRAGLYGCGSTCSPHLSFPSLVATLSPAIFVVFVVRISTQGEPFMKGLLRSRLVLSLAAFLMVMAAIAISLSGSLTRSHAQGTSTVSFTKAATPIVAPGGTVKYTLTLTNTSPTGTLPLHDIHFTDVLPTPQLTAITVGPTFTITPPTGGGFGSCTPPTGLTVSCTVDDFAPGSVVTITFSATVNTIATGTITNTATAQSFDIGTVTAMASTAVTAPSRKQLFIFLQGISSDLGQKGVTDSTTGLGKINGLGTVPDTIRKNFPSAIFREYTYPIDKKGQNQGIPHPYTCVDTFTHTLDQDIRTLSLQITNAAISVPNADIYLVGHSLGGVIEIGYVAYLVESLEGVALPTGANLKSVITLDSPLGGVPDGQYIDLAKLIFSNIPFTSASIPGLACKGLAGEPFKSPVELGKIFDSASKEIAVDDTGPFIRDPQGAAASILAIPSVKLPATLPFPSPNGNPLPTNEELVEQAQTQFGTSFLTVGNERDFLWKPVFCEVSFAVAFFAVFHEPLILTIGNFKETQWLEDEGDGNMLYGRHFTAPAGFFHTCVDSIGNLLNHKEVLTNSDVATGIQHFLSPLGSTPSPLAVPSGIQPEP